MKGAGWLADLRIDPGGKKRENHGKPRPAASDQGDGGLRKAAAQDAIEGRAHQRGQHHEQE